MAQINVIGIIAKDPELKDFKDFQVASFPLAYTPREKKGAAWVDGETVWFRVSITGKNAPSFPLNYRKGDRVLVVGTLKVSKYTDKDGNEKQGLDIRNPSVAVFPKTKIVETESAEGWDQW